MIPHEQFVELLVMSLAENIFSKYHALPYFPGSPLNICNV